MLNYKNVSRNMQTKLQRFKVLEGTRNKAPSSSKKKMTISKTEISNKV